MTKDEALRLALEALELVSIEFVCNGAHHAKKDRHEWLDPCPIVDRYKDAITAIKAALEANDEPVAFKIYKPTPPRGAIPNVRDAELPWVYDQDPSSGNVASMWVTPVKATPPQPVIDESAAKRIATALGWEPKRKSLREEMVKQMKLSCDSMEMRGAFADGWLSAEAAHGIKGGA